MMRIESDIPFNACSMSTIFVLCMTLLVNDLIC